MKDKSHIPLAFSPLLAAALVKSGLSVIVTGGSSWLGQATLEMLEQCLGEKVARHVHVFGSHARALTLRSGRILPCHTLNDLAQLTPRPCLILHYAFITRSHAAKMPLADFIARNEAIGNLVAAEAQRLGCTGIFVPSSGAVYRADRSMETDLECNPYGVMKMRDEQRFLALQPQMKVVVCRIFNLAGPFINNPEYVLASIITRIQQDKPVCLRADKEVWRSYVHIRDMIELIFSLLLAKDTPPAIPFDTAGGGAIEAGDLALRAGRLLGSGELVIKRPALRGPVDRYVGDGATMAALMARHAIPLQTLSTQIIDTACYLAGTTPFTPG